MKDAGKVVEGDKEAVDKLESTIATRFKDPLFNDKHIVALSYVTNARLVCTKDSVLQSYLKAKEFYSKGKKKPKIFNSKSKPKTIPTGSFNPTCALCS